MTGFAADFLCRYFGIGLGECRWWVTKNFVTLFFGIATNEYNRKMNMRYICAIAALAITIGATARETSPAKDSSSDRNLENRGSAADVAEMAQAINGEWDIVSAGKNDIELEDDMPYVIFDNRDNSYYLFNGCNMVNGSYVVEGSSLMLMNSIMTQKYCADLKFDSVINAAMRDNQPVKVAFETRGNESYLTLTNANTATTLTLRRHNMLFLNGLWRVKRLVDENIKGDELDIFFDIASKKVHGNTGCNFFNGEIRIDPTVANSLNLSGMGVTRMACPNTDRELKYLVALEDVTSAVKTSANTVALLNRAGKQVVLLERKNIETR